MTAEDDLDKLLRQYNRLLAENSALKTSLALGQEREAVLKEQLLEYESELEESRKPQKKPLSAGGVMMAKLTPEGAIDDTSGVRRIAPLYNPVFGERWTFDYR
jgi:hypothetical protein